MGYLSAEIFVFLLVAFLLGLVLGWWIWANRNSGRVAELQQDLATTQKALTDCQAARQRIEREDSAARTKLTNATNRIAQLEAELAKAQTAASTPAPAPEPEPVKPMGLVSGVPAADEAVKAKLAASPFLDKPAGIPDDLMLIKGIGPKLGALLHTLGVYHFFQIAGWSEADVAKVDAEMKNFKGRITRDNWIDQAGLLAAGDHAAFIAKYGEMGENRK